MRSLGELGIGLSVVFCVFVLALVAELCYIFCWKRRKLAKSTSADRLKNAIDIRGKMLLHSNSSPDFVREASLVGSFGGYPSSVVSEVGSGFDPLFGESLLHSSSHYPPSHLLFSIKEETKEDMELASGLGNTMKSNSRMRSRTPSDVLAIHFTSGSTSPAASLDTPFTTPTSSPPPASEKLAPMPKLSPFAACAVRPTSCGRSSSPIAEIHIISAYQGSSSPVINGQGRTSLQLLFERSPLWQRPFWPQSPAAHPPISPLRGLPAGAAESFDVSQPPYCHHHLSLRALFRQTSSAPCGLTCHSPPQTNKSRMDA